VSQGDELKHDLRRIRLMIESGLPLTPETHLQPGQRVRVRGGPLEGQEGVIVMRHGQRRFLVVIDFLQQGASVLLDNCEVERVN
jgi:transcriptional antiterminator RfaH